MGYGEVGKLQGLSIRPCVPDDLSHVSVTPMMSRSFDETKSLKADVLLRNDRAFSRLALIFLTDGPGFKLMSPERIKMMNHQPPRVDISEIVCHLTTVGLQGSKSNVATVQRG